MYRRDHILTEVEKIAQMLAKLLGLKSSNQHQEAQKFYEDTLNNEFDLQPDKLNTLTNDDFAEHIRQKGYNANKLNLLAQLLYYDATTMFKHPAEASLLLRKTLLIFDMLECEHHMQSFENITLRTKIHQLIEQHHA